MLAYDDCWMFIRASFAVVIPAAFLLRRARGGAGGRALTGGGRR
jgi:hypothetical protein